MSNCFHSKGDGLGRGGGAQVISLSGLSGLLGLFSPLAPHLGSFAFAVLSLFPLIWERGCGPKRDCSCLLVRQPLALRVLVVEGGPHFLSEWLSWAPGFLLSLPPLSLQCWHLGCCWGHHHLCLWQQCQAQLPEDLTVIIKEKSHQPASASEVCLRSAALWLRKVLPSP